MVVVINQHRKPIGKWMATAFLVSGVVFVGDAAIVAASIVTEPEPLLTLGQAFVGAGWTAAFIGLLGFYPDLVDRSRWLTRAGAVFAVIGAITVAVMAATSLGYFTGILSGELSEVSMFFLPGVFLGIVLGFGLFSVAGLRTNIHPRSIGLLFLVLPITFLFNLGTGIAGFNPLLKVLGVVCVLALTMLAIGYLIRNENVLADREDVATSSDPTA